MWKLMIVLVTLLFFPMTVRATDEFVTIVNPVRISTYNPNPAASIKAQYEIIKKFGLPATWLLTLDSLDQTEVVAELKKFDQGQELGLFLEVTKNSADKAGIAYHDTGSWHFANAVLLSGYTQPERIKYIDYIFERFKSIFGYYPKSVGSWWTDGYSLSYMHDKYGITADLGCSDQLETDNYSLLGQYWSVPYYPNKIHVGIPASTQQDKLNVVRLLWAPRDPDLGYESSLYSTQDYFTLPNLNIGYFKKLVETYAAKQSNQFGQVTLGLESDFPPQSYLVNFLSQMEYLAQTAYQKVTMSQFASYYQQKFTGLSPAHKIGKWYMSPRYRLGHKDGKIVDLRSYLSLPEPYYQRPNRENTLYINIASAIDKKNDPQSVWNIGQGRVNTFKDYFEVYFPDSPPPPSLTNSGLFKVEKMADGYRIRVGKDSMSDITKEDWSPESVYSFRSKRFWTWKFERQKYLISAEEILALTKVLGKVLVYDHDCLQCEYHSEYKPAAILGVKGYIGQLSGKKVVYSREVFEIKDLLESEKTFKKLGVDYVYLTKYEQFIEKIPFSPGDWNLEKIYENGNAVVYRVVK